MPREVTIELFKEAMKFSAGHFTIFSAVERENMHGHNYTLHVALRGLVGEDGLMFDYRPLKKHIIAMCRAWNETFLLPGHSPYLTIDTSDPKEIRAHFGEETLRFLSRDVTILPILNVSLEELARLVGTTMLEAPFIREQRDVRGLVVKCASGPGQCIDWRWDRPEE